MVNGTGEFLRARGQTSTPAMLEAVREAQCSVSKPVTAKPFSAKRVASLLPKITEPK